MMSNMANNQFQQYIGLNNFKVNRSIKPGIAQRLGVPLQKKNLKRPFTGGATNTVNKIGTFDARMKLTKKPMDARARLLAKKRLMEAMGQTAVQDARIKLQAKQKTKTKVNNSNAVNVDHQPVQQNQFSIPTPNFTSQEFAFQQPIQYQQPLIIPQQQQMFPQQQIMYQPQQQQQVYQPGIYNVSGTLLKTIQGQQNMIEYVKQPVYVENLTSQKPQVAVKKNMVRLKPITAPSPRPSTSTFASTTDEITTNSGSLNAGWTDSAKPNLVQKDTTEKVSALDRIVPSSGFSPIQSYKVIVSNLASTVSYEDVEELFGSIGPIRRIRYSKPQVVDVFFVERNHALASVNKYHNRELDGLPMSVVMAPNQPHIQHLSNIPEVKTLLSCKSKVTTIEINPSVVHQALFKSPFSSGSKDIKFTVRM